MYHVGNIAKLQKCSLKMLGSASGQGSSNKFYWKNSLKNVFFQLRSSTHPLSNTEVNFVSWITRTCCDKRR